ncbi:MAG: NAD(P)-dependent oxidoreductase [Patescibacteria group bacterium]
MRIIIAQNLNFDDDQLEKLGKLGSLKVYENPKSEEEWLERCQNADIICSGSRFMKTEVYGLTNKFITIPMTGYSWLDLEKLKEKNIIFANCPGCNKYAVTEWILAMTLELTRKFTKFINTNKSYDINFPSIGLKGKNIVILGKGSIGALTGNVLTALGSSVSFYQRGDSLVGKIKNADIVINCLSTNPTTIGLLDKNFFDHLKKGVYFVTTTPSDILDQKSMMGALDQGIIAGIATDCASVGPRDTADPRYIEMSSNPKIIATPHIAWFSDTSIKDENDIMIDNIEAWIEGKPQNIIT